MNSRSLVIFSMMTILIISVIISIVGWNIRTYDSHLSDQVCKRSGNYCVFNDIPAGVQYSKPSQQIPNSEEYDGDLLTFLDTTYDQSEPKTPRTYEVYDFWNIEEYKCKSDGETPKIIEYYREFCGGGTRIGYGCGKQRRAIVCEDEYLIQDTNNYDSKLYGPFSTPELIN